MKALIDWSLKQHSHLPWRKERTLYRTFVSEVMLQQTTVSTVLNHFDRFIERFPDIETLANATEEEVCLQWQGLGYYRRARNLHKGARHLLAVHCGIIPTDVETLMQVPGIGPYTAHAIVSIGANQRGLPVDANLERILSRLYRVPEEKGPKLQKKLLKLFEEKKILKGVENFGFRKTYEALMDLGRDYCQAKKAYCAQCPLKKMCQGHENGDAEKFPVIRKKKANKHELTLKRFIIKKAGKVLAYQKSEKEWLSGQWEIPTFTVSSTDKKLSQYPPLPKKLEKETLRELKSGITTYKIINQVSQAKKNEVEMYFKKMKWIDPLCEETHLSTTSRKILKAVDLI